MSADKVEKAYQLERPAILERMASGDTYDQDVYTLLLSTVESLESGDELRVRILRVMLEELDLHRVDGTRELHGEIATRIEALAAECQRWLP